MQTVRKLQIRAQRTFTGVLTTVLIFSLSLPAAVSAQTLTPANTSTAASSPIAPGTDSGDGASSTKLTVPTPAPAAVTTPPVSTSTAKPDATEAPAGTPPTGLTLPASQSSALSVAQPGLSDQTTTARDNPTLVNASTTTTTATPIAPIPDQAITLQTKVDSTATSGNAAVLNNDHAGNATSGKAAVDATIVNVVGSGTGFGTMTTFVKNIYNTPGSNEIQGSITIDPNTLMTTGGTASNITWQNPTQGSVSLTDIQNDIVLDATSGNANVIGNDHAGNASTGDASALANVINIVSSSIGAQHSFLGVVNIYGNLKGDILVPSSLVDNLFGSNAIGGAGSTNGTGGSVPAAPSIDDNTSITNNIHLTAASGGADVSNNDHAGDATTGSATTNLTVFNLTGQAVIAKNSLLVFVNVLGKWVGVIINAPAGSTAAALSGNLSGNSSGTPATNQQSDGSFNNTVNITNNITATATSGNAAVTGNDHAGNATSGNATASANILNLVHSSFSLDDWFGVLFINVIGSWLGNFGITSAAPAVTPAPGGDGVQAVKVFRFDSTTAFKPASSTRRSSGSSVTTESEPALATVAATESTGHVLGDVSGNSLQSLPRALGGRDFTSAIAMLAGLFLLLVLTALVLRHRRLVRNHNTSGGGAIG